MARPFDVTTKHLFEHHPRDWLVYAGLEPGPAELLNVDLSTLSATADHVLRVGREAPWLAHFEFQSGRDLALARRLQLYNVLLNHHHDLPVQTVVVLLRRSADGPELTGLFRQGLPDGRLYHEFHYRIVRVWEKPVEAILSGGLGTLPLAPLVDEARDDLPKVIRRMESRLAGEAPVEEMELFWTAV